MLITLDEAKNNLRVDTADDDGLIESILTAARKLCILFTRDNQSGEEVEGIAGSGQEKTGTEDSVMFSRRAVNNALVNKLEKHYGKCNQPVKDQAAIPNTEGVSNGRSADELRERLSFIKKFI